MTHRVDRLWPDPALDLDLDEALAGFALPAPPAGRPFVGVNMVTTVDGRAQLRGTAEGLGSRADRRLMRHYRAAYDAVASGVGTLLASGVWLRVPADLARARAAAGRPAQPTGVVIAGRSRVPSETGWFGGDEPRILFVGSASPHAAGRSDAFAGTELVVAPTPEPEVAWLLARLAERGIRSLLVEGGPTLNASFLAADLIDELYWTIGAKLLGTDALRMIAPIPDGSPWRDEPRAATLLSVHRHQDELFLRYRLPR